MATPERDLPPELERELDGIFAACSPPGHVDELAALLDEVEAVADVDVDVPTDSDRPGGAIAKRGIKAALGWYVGQMAQQQSHFATVTARALRLLTQHAAATPAAADAARAELRRLAPRRDVSDWIDLVAGRMAKAPGRVLHADAGEGALLVGLSAAGIDAYGVEPAPTLHDRATAAGLEVRSDDAVTHLRSVPEGALGGVVLSGCTDHEALAVQLELADLTTSRVRSGGSIVVLGLLPEEWSGDAVRVEADLAPGWPLQPGTWEHLFSTRQLAPVSLETRPRRGDEDDGDGSPRPGFAVTAVRG